MEEIAFSNYLIILIVPIIGIAFKSIIKESIKNIFKSLDSNQLNLILIVIIVVISGLSYWIIYEYTSQEPTSILVENEKSELEEYVETGKIIIDEIDKLSKSKKRKDSLARASKEPYWVIKIGKPKRNIKSIWPIYRQLDSIAHLRVFKASRKEYFLIRDNNLALPELKQDLENLKEIIQDFETDLQIIDLNTHCKVKQDILEINPLRLKREGLSVKCYSCG